MEAKYAEIAPQKLAKISVPHQLVAQSNATCQLVAAVASTYNTHAAFSAAFASLMVTSMCALWPYNMLAL